MITGKEAERVLEAVRSLDGIAPGLGISVVQGELMGIPVNIICGVEAQPFGGEGMAVAFSPIMVICDPAIASRLTIAGNKADHSGPILMAPEGRA